MTYSRAPGRTALVATEGFTDVVSLGRQNQADLYRLCAARPAPLVPPFKRTMTACSRTPNRHRLPLDGGLSVNCGTG